MNFLLPTKLKNAWALNGAVLLFALGGLAASFIVGVGGLSAMAQPPDEVKLDANTVPQLHKQIRPQPGESRWLELPWLIDLHAARQKAAAEGKPLFVLSGGGATGIGAC
jgi:hypothetical protein